MERIFAESRISVFTDTYNEVTRLPIGGTLDAYPTEDEAWDNAVSGDTVLCREGFVGAISSPGIVRNKDVEVLRYRDEVPFVTPDIGDFSAVSITNAAKWDIQIKGGGPATPSDSHRAIVVNIATATVGFDVVNYTGQPYRYSRSDAGTLTVTRCRSINCSRAGIITNSNAAGIMIVNNMFSKNCKATSGPGVVLFNDGDITVNSPIVIGGDTPTAGQGAVKVGSNADITFNNPIMVGGGINGETNFPLVNDSALCAINGGILNGNIFDPLGTVYKDNGTILWDGNVDPLDGSTIFNGFVIPPDSPSFENEVTFIAEDSSHSTDAGVTADTISLDIYGDAFAAVNASFTYCPDDQIILSPDQFTVIKNFLQKGGELGMKNESSTLLSNRNALRVTLVGVTTNNVAIVVDTDSGAASSIKIISDFGGANTVQKTILLSTATKVGNQNELGTSFVFDEIRTVVSFDGTTLALEDNSNDGFPDDNQYDDAQSGGLKSGTFLVTSTVTPVIIPMDPVKWFPLDITTPRDILLEGADLANIETFFSQGAEDTGQEALDFLTANGFKTVYRGQGGNSSVFSLITDPFSISRQNLGIQDQPVKVRGGGGTSGETVQVGIGLVTYADGLATNAENFRQWARNLCTYAATYGVYTTIKLARKLDVESNNDPDDYIWADSDIAALVTELRACGAEVRTSAAATAAIQLGISGDVIANNPIVSSFIG